MKIFSKIIKSFFLSFLIVSITIGLFPIDIIKMQTEINDFIQNDKNPTKDKLPENLNYALVPDYYEKLLNKIKLSNFTSPKKKKNIYYQNYNKYNNFDNNRKKILRIM